MKQMLQDWHCCYFTLLYRMQVISGWKTCQPILHLDFANSHTHICACMRQGESDKLSARQYWCRLFVRCFRENLYHCEWWCLMTRRQLDIIITIESNIKLCRQHCPCWLPSTIRCKGICRHGGPHVRDICTYRTGPWRVRITGFNIEWPTIESSQNIDGHVIKKEYKYYKGPNTPRQS